MPVNPTYSVGTIAVSAGSAVVNGTGTLWVAEGIEAGDILERNGLSVTVQSVESNTQLTLVKGWPGATGSGTYEVRYTPDASRVLTNSRAAIAMFEAQGAAVETAINAFGGLWRDDFNALMADKIFSYGLGVGQVQPGDVVKTRSENFAYLVMPSAATTHHVTTAGGVKLQVLPTDTGYNVKAFGALCDGITDDTTALQTCASAATAASDSVVTNSLAARRRHIFYIPPGPGTVLSAKLTLGKNVSVVMDGPILVSAATNIAQTWVEIAATAAVNRQGRGLRYVIDVRRVTQSNWSSRSDIGCAIIGAAAADVWLRRADNFCVGVVATLPYSNVKLGEFRNCQIGLDLVGTAHDFTNQMILIGGEFANEGGVNPAMPRYGLRVTNPGTIAGAPANGNTFTGIGQSFELHAGAAGAAECIPYVLTGVWHANFKSIRMEGSGQTVARLEGDSRWCFFDVMANLEFEMPSAGMLIDNSTFKMGNRARHETGEVDWRTGFLVFDSGALIDQVTRYDGSNWHIRDMEVLQNTAPASFSLSGGMTTVDYKSRRVRPSAIFGVRVDTRGAKTFAVIADGPTNKDISLQVVVFDAQGNQLTGTDVYKNGATPTVTANTGAYGGFYSLGSELDGLRRIATLQFSSAVATAFIGLVGGDLSSIRIYAQDGAATFFSKSTQRARGRRLATAPPATGFYSHGDIVAHAAPAVGSAAGWVCVRQGQSGSPIGGTAATTSGSRSVTFSNASALFVGASVTISGVTGIKVIEALQGSVALLDSNCDATVSAGSVSSATALFGTLPALS